MIQISANPAVHAAMARARATRGKDLVVLWRWMTFPH